MRYEYQIVVIKVAESPSESFKFSERRDRGADEPPFMHTSESLDEPRLRAQLRAFDLSEAQIDQAIADARSNFKPGQN